MLLNQVLPGEVHAIKIHARNRPVQSKTSHAGMDAWLAKLGTDSPNDPAAGGADPLSGLAVLRADGWAVALVSSSPEPVTATIVLPPESGQAPRKLTRLDAPSPSSDNEDKATVHSIVVPLDKAAPLAVTIPAYGFAVLTP